MIQCLDSLKPEEISEASIVQLQSAENAKENLKRDFDEVVVNANELRDALEARGDTAEAVKEKLKFDRMEELTNVAQINRNLEIIVMSQKLKYFTSPTLISTVKEAVSRELTSFKENIAKVNEKNVEKIKKPKVVGQADLVSSEYVHENIST